MSREPKLKLPGPGAPPPRPAKRALFQLGERIPDRVIYGLLGVFNYVHLGWWLRRKRFPVGAIVADRYAVFDRMATVAGERAVLYLEFGVAGGESLRYWSGLLRHPDSVLHGFDSFEGLPTGWALGWPANVFTQEGRLPEIGDERVTLFAGWFSDTLPQYTWPEGYDQLILTMDADLYSSTAFVLERLESRIIPGTLIYFDEFHHFADELKAFEELLERTGWGFEIVAATSDFSQLAFRRVA